MENKVLIFGHKNPDTDSICSSLVKEKLNKILAQNTKQDLKTITADTERDNFLSAEEALNYGLIDQIINKNEL